MHDLDDWLASLAARHQAQFTRSEFLKAVRALSARYVERRALLRERSPLDSAGKQAAFAAFYTPLHLLTTTAIVNALQPPRVDRVIDLGCGAGAAGAGWALASSPRPLIVGFDRSSWALSEARWNWRHLGLQADARRGDLVVEAEKLLGGRPAETRPERHVQSAAWTGSAIVLGWSANELSDSDRDRLLAVLLELGDRGATVLVVEPLARSAVPWWSSWAGPWLSAQGRADEWKFAADLPRALADVDRDAGFQRQQLMARSLYLCRCI